MKTIYINKISIKGFIGYSFIDDDNIHTYIDYRVIDKTKLKDLEKYVEKIETLSSNKFLINNINFITNGKNIEIGKIDIVEKTFRGKGAFSNFGEDASLTYMLCYSLSRVICNDVKVYKLNGVKINV